MSRRKAAVIGSGVSGLTAAHVLRHKYDVTLFEAGDKLGGHADTHDVITPDGSSVAVDTGFLVHNAVTYPTLTRLFRELGVSTRETEMSMSIRCLGCGLEYAGGKGGLGMVPSGGSPLREYARMLADVPRFYRAARTFEFSEDGGPSFGQFLTAGRFSRYFTEHFALPLVSAVWSTGEHHSLTYPATHLFAFLRNHGMLSPVGSLPWRTVIGGSRTYVDKIGAAHAVRTGTRVEVVRRHVDDVELIDAAGHAQVFDCVVLATHADQALALLADATALEKQVLGAFTYSRNEARLHSDAALLPTRARVHAAWNYLKPACEGRDRVLVSYDLNRLMRLSEPVPHVLSLNAGDRVDASRVIKELVYRHPVYTAEAVAAQRRLPELNSPRLAFAGAYHGWGFHEDGCVAGVRAALALGVRW
ncbi:FAD-dependent oxidoreductase [Actinosynnema sp. NPDC050801]|uniref:NAD(P)/FAD-dependent oxidoreductase n=1 Tax=unclassified Actinosynnema TaxID=2637065 RepID=UPI0033CEBBF5